MLQNVQWRDNAGNAAFSLARKAITHAKVSVGRGSEAIVMFLHLAIHVHTARVLLFTVKLGAIGGTSILTGAMVASLTSLVSRIPSNVTKVICIAFLHISEFTVGTGLFTIFQLVVSALAYVAIVNYNFASRTVHLPIRSFAVLRWNPTCFVL